MKKAVKFIAIILVALGSTAAFNSISAQAAHTSPRSIRGTWYRNRYGYSGQKIIVGKHSFYVVNLQYGKKSGRATYVSGKSFYCSPRKTKNGYWNVGFAHSDGIWPLKRTTHNHRKALRSYYTLLGVSNKPVINYYYR